MEHSIFITRRFDGVAIIQPSANGEFVYVDLETVGRELWKELHEKRDPDQDWFDSWRARIPAFGCKCVEEFTAILERIPVRFDDWFSWTNEVHNAVNANIQRRVMLLREAMRIWRPDLLPRLEPIAGVVAVTSLAPNRPDTRRILDSWVRLGLSIVCVQTEREADSIQDAYGDIVRVIAAPDFASEYESPTVLISSLLDVAHAVDSPILLINSDIEIDATPENRQAIIDAATNGHFSVGVRWNHPGVTIAESTREPYGLDAFVISPEQVAQLKKERYEIGRPMWDYWLPFSVRFNGHKIHQLPEKMFYHREHAQRWSQAEWMMGRGWFESEHGAVFDWHQFRGELI